MKQIRLFFIIYIFIGVGAFSFAEDATRTVEYNYYSRNPDGSFIIENVNASAVPVPLFKYLALYKNEELVEVKGYYYSTDKIKFIDKITNNKIKEVNYFDYYTANIMYTIIYKYGFLGGNLSDVSAKRNIAQGDVNYSIDTKVKYVYDAKEEKIKYKVFALSKGDKLNEIKILEGICDTEYRVLEFSRKTVQLLDTKKGLDIDFGSIRADNGLVSHTPVKYGIKSATTSSSILEGIEYDVFYTMIPQEEGYVEIYEKFGGGRFEWVIATQNGNIYNKHIYSKTDDLGSKLKEWKTTVIQTYIRLKNDLIYKDYPDTKRYIISSQDEVFYAEKLPRNIIIILGDFERIEFWCDDREQQMVLK